MLPINLNYLPHELAHYHKLVNLANECTLFLKRENDAFPIKKPCRAALFGSGARHTVKGGTGSGDVNSHFFNNIEDELENNGFEITTKKWLHSYDVIRENAFKEFVKTVKKEAKEKGLYGPAYSVGQCMPEAEYDLSLEEYEGEIAIYVLSRTSGEGADRRKVKGDLYLTDTEIKDILYLNKKFEKFILVLNVPGPVDLSPVMEVNNILLLSQLGVATSQVFVDILLGKANPSGKLSTTWTKIADYPFFDEFGDKDDTNYLEGIYVGYRYFSSKNIKPLFPFGYGLSYSTFKREVLSYKIQDGVVSIEVKTTNESEYAGKDVIQIYLSFDSDIVTPKWNLVAFKKSDLIQPHQSEVLKVEYVIKDFTFYDTLVAGYVLPQSICVVVLGEDSFNVTPIFKYAIDKYFIVKKVNRLKQNEPFNDYFTLINKRYKHLDIPQVTYHTPIIETEYVNYNNYQVEIPDYIKSLTTDELILLNMGDYKLGLAGVIGQAGSVVLGCAGETTLRVESLKKYLSMADGPAGLRLISEYVQTNKGTYQLQEDSIWKGIKPYLPGFLVKLLDIKRNHKKQGKKVFQYCSALPIATALAQSYNPDLLYECGRLVNKEMTIYNVDMWLAPGINLHRNIRCGRNFEYYSEDPYLTSEMASALINGVQSQNNKMCVVKHYLCNNQETNRFNSSSNVSERALRELYLSSFSRVIKKSNPVGVMSSYNLVNGEHTSESKDLLINVLRCELGFKGLVMTDWIKTGQINDKSSKHPAARASKCLTRGVNLIMPGSKDDIKDIKLALNNGEITREDLENNAAIVYQLINSK